MSTVEEVEEGEGQYEEEKGELNQPSKLSIGESLDTTSHGG